METFTHGNNKYQVIDIPIKGHLAFNRITKQVYMVVRVLTHLDRMSIMEGETIKIVCLSLYKGLIKLDMRILQAESDLEMLYHKKVEKVKELNQILYNQIIHKISKPPIHILKSEPRISIHKQLPTVITHFIKKKRGRPYAPDCNCSLGKNKCNRMVCPHTKSNKYE